MTVINQIFLLIWVLTAVFFVWRISFITSKILKAKHINAQGFSWENIYLFFARRTVKSTSTFLDKLTAATLHTVLIASLVMMIIDMALDGEKALFTNITMVFAIGGFVASGVFIIRRIILKVSRLNTSDLSPTNKADAIVILLLEMLSTASYILMQYWGEWMMLVHYSVMAFFLLYITYSKHLHILFALPYMIYSGERPRSLSPIPLVSAELSGAIAPEQKMGANTVYDLSRGDIFGAFACTQCGRCTELCPVSMVGGELSPCKVMIDVRRVCLSNDTTLYPQSISDEKIYSCISCGACVQACPIGIDPLSVILQIRRYAALEDGSLPKEYSSIASNTQATGNPWAFSMSQNTNKQPHNDR